MFRRDRGIRSIGVSRDSEIFGDVDVNAIAVTAGASTHTMLQDTQIDKTSEEKAGGDIGKFIDTDMDELNRLLLPHTSTAGISRLDRLLVESVDFTKELKGEFDDYLSNLNLKDIFSSSKSSAKPISILPDDELLTTCDNNQSEVSSLTLSAPLSMAKSSSNELCEDKRNQNHITPSPKISDRTLTDTVNDNTSRNDVLTKLGFHSSAKSISSIINPQSSFTPDKLTTSMSAAPLNTSVWTTPVASVRKKSTANNFIPTSALLKASPQLKYTPRPANQVNELTTPTARMTNYTNTFAPPPSPVAPDPRFLAPYNSQSRYPPHSMPTLQSYPRGPLPNNYYQPNGDYPYPPYYPSTPPRPYPYH